MNTSSYDVAVIGGGPAGATAATFLQRKGHRCVILESARFPRYHIGESLIPNTHGTLDRLGLLPRMKASHFPEKHSVRFVSASGKSSDPFYFSDTVEGDAARTWQVERSEFDSICLDHARENGVEVHRPTRVESLLMEGDQATGVLVRPEDGEPREIAASVVIDASGRGTLIGNQLGLKGPVPGLKKASLWTYFKGGERLPGRDAGETTVFMIPERGWFWYIPLPDDRVSVGVVASPEYLFKGSESFEEAFLREAGLCAPLGERLVHAERDSPVRGFRELAYLNRQTAGNGWVMIGDAAAFLDPIYSSGIYLAIASAEMAADCIDDALSSGDLSAGRLGAYSASLLEGVDVIHSLINAFYDPDFSFRKFVERFPEQRPALIDCLVGDVVGKDMSEFLNALAQMSTPPQPLASMD